MKIVIAIDSFKGSISSLKGSEAIASGVREVFPEADISSFPLADGGEGTVDCLIHATSGKRIEKSVTGPLGEKVTACYGVLDDNKTAVIEIASACGLPLISDERRNPEETTTYGVGELIKHAISKGCRNFVIGLGGSATNDAGAGMLQALGFRFMDETGNEIGRGGASLINIRQVDKSDALPELAACAFHIACDVDSPLYGEKGAAYIFAPQKGADPAAVHRLDEGLRQFAEVSEQVLGKEIHSVKGAGAAGGLGAAFKGYLNGRLESGVELLIRTMDLEEKIKGAHIIITGEGKIDAQTSMGKVPYGVARIADRYGIPVIVLAGSVDDEAEKLYQMGITACFPIPQTPLSLEEAMKPEIALANLKRTATQIFRVVRDINGK